MFLQTLTDSIDLQDRDAPSAKDHHGNATASKHSLNGPVGSHQAETLREVAAETAEERRVSWNNGDIGDLQQYAEELAAGVDSSLNAEGHRQRGGKDRMDGHQQEDALAIAQNGGRSGADTSDDGESEGEEDEDDMMDKMSSSPSIEDGGSTCVLPRLVNYFQSSSPRSPRASATLSEARSSSPYLDPPEHLPLHMSPQQPASDDSIGSQSRHHHLPGEHNEQQQILRTDRSSSSIYSDYIEEHNELAGEDWVATDAGLDLATPDTLATADDCDDACDDDKVYDGDGEDEVEDGDGNTASALGDRPQVKAQKIEVDEGLGGFDEDEDVLTIPYDGSSGDDDDDFSHIEDPRFIDSGWGGECLQDTEDIDFDLVYALHTFVATVEGQANATKGDTMMLLDDSNSYWWLVRVLKDSSIGRSFLCRHSPGNFLTLSILGYLPAEHIETPTERLARLNKHRNIDVRHISPLLRTFH